MCSNQTIDILVTNSNELTLQWNLLSFRTPKTGTHESKQILKDVSGSAKSNSFTAIMGPSGAGKTFLLENIAQKVEGVDGFVTLNNVLINRNIMNDFSGYLPQEDTVTDFLTASEYLQFICTMKLGSTHNKHKRNIRIEEICSNFYLKKSWNTKIRNLSGGEKKQLLLAGEMLSDPLILLCDEPTSGLDGYNALNVIQILKEISSRNKIVIITVHQPSVDIIQYFNNIILLSQGVKVLEGSNDKISTFFCNLNIICPASCNIAEFYVNQVSVMPGKEKECTEKIDRIRKSFLDTQAVTDSPEKLEVLQYNKKRTCPLYIQFIWLLWREHLEMKRNSYWTFATLATLIFTSCIIALFFSMQEDRNHTIIQNINGLLFLVVSELLYTFSFSVLNTFSTEIPIFTRERELYSVTMYYLAVTCIKIPQIILFIFTFLITVSFSSILTWNLLIMLKMGTILCFASFVAIAYGFMISALFGTPEYVNLVIVPLNLMFILTSGMYITLRSIWVGVAWLKHFSTFLYTYELLVILYWNFLDDIECSNDTACKRLGPQALAERGFNENHLNYNIVALCLLATGMHIISLFAVLYRKKKCSPLYTRSTIFC